MDKIRLPSVLEDLILSFVDKFNYWESLPSIHSIETLIEKSNKSICQELMHRGFIPPHVLMGLKSFSFAFMLSFYNHDILEKTIGFCLNRCLHTSSLFWLFIRSKPSIYHGPYARRFESHSLLYHLINVVTMSPKSSTESSYLCLQRESPTAGFSICHL